VPDDPVTLGELGRRIDAGFASVNARLDTKVSAEVLALQQAAQDERHKALAEQVAMLRKDIEKHDEAMEAREEADEKRIRDYRRWLVGAIVIPVMVVLLPLLLTRGKL
jgi:hypothetical protein